MRLSVFAGCIAVHATALAQAPVHVRGRVVDRSTGLPIEGAAIRLDTIHGGSSSATGAFVVTGPYPARYTVHVSAAGYAPWQHSAIIRRDTVVTVDMMSAPFSVRPASRGSRAVTVRMVIRDATTRRQLTDVDVVASSGIVKAISNPDTVALRVPADTIGLSASAFGYRPAILRLVARRDTIVTVFLREDPAVSAMIEAQLERIDRRARPRLPKGNSVITRDQILAAGNTNAISVLRASSYFLTFQCALLNDRYLRGRPGRGGMFAPPFRGVLDTIHAARVMRIERLERGKMIRIYTRGFLRDLITGRATLRPVAYEPNWRTGLRCR